MAAVAITRTNVDGSRHFRAARLRKSANATVRHRGDRSRHPASQRCAARSATPGSGAGGFGSSRRPSLDQFALHTANATERRPRIPPAPTGRTQPDLRRLLSIASGWSGAYVRAVHGNGGRRQPLTPRRGASRDRRGAQEHLDTIRMSPTRLVNSQEALNIRRSLPRLNAGSASCSIRSRTRSARRNGAHYQSLLDERRQVLDIRVHPNMPAARY